VGMHCARTTPRDSTSLTSSTPGSPATRDLAARTCNEVDREGIETWGLPGCPESTSI
jgi:hypothetical protein